MRTSSALHFSFPPTGGEDVWKQDAFQSRQHGKTEVTDGPPTFLPPVTLPLTSSQYASLQLSSGRFVPPIGRWRRSFDLLLLERSLGSKWTDARGGRRGEPEGAEAQLSHPVALLQANTL